MISESKANTRIVPDHGAQLQAPRSWQAANTSSVAPEEFYHLAEGSELYPLSWLRALPTPTGEMLFMEVRHLEQLGLIADEISAANPDGLPIGMTVDKVADRGLAGFKVVGFNCAACHVGELEVDGKRYRVEGAPNLFDIGRFNAELVFSFERLKQPAEALEFLRRLHKQHRPDTEHGERSTLLARSERDVAVLYEALPTYGELQHGKPTDQLVAREIERIVREEFAHAARAPAADLEQLRLGLEPERKDGNERLALPSALAQRAVRTVDPAAAPEARMREVGKVLARALSEDRASFATERFALVTEGTAAGEGDARMRNLAVLDLLADLRQTLRWIAQRTSLIRHSVTSVPATKPGPGRVDAFGAARNGLFHTQQPLYGPVSYPHLWGMAKVKWRHWDGSTDSARERNVGQALGLGAVADVRRGTTSVNLLNIDQLELYAWGIQAPRWPFGEVDREDAREGAKLFAERCEGCHNDEVAASEWPMMDVGTDRQRLLSFNAPLRVKGRNKSFPDVLSGLLRAVTSIATPHGTPSQEYGVWRKTDANPDGKPGGYVRRSLAGIWATAPYLHNGSVPTLDDLLRPAAERPKTFKIGSRKFDTERVGYVNEGDDFVTTRADPRALGNSDEGHPYTIADPAQRRQLIAHLKLR